MNKKVNVENNLFSNPYRMGANINMAVSECYITYILN